VVLAYNPDAKIYELVGTAYSVTLVAGFAPLAFGLYTRFVTSFGALISIVSGVSGWLIAQRLEASVPAIFIGFVCSLVGIIFGSYLGTFIVKENKILN
jgi:Na+/pantothenate symporter